MSTTYETATKIISFAASVIFSLTMLVFSLYMVVKQPTNNQLYLSIATTIMSLWLPSPLQVSGLLTAAKTPVPVAAVVTA